MGIQDYLEGRDRDERDMRHHRLLTEAKMKIATKCQEKSDRPDDVEVSLKITMGQLRALWRTR